MDKVKPKLKAKRGRPPFEITPEVLEKVKALGAQGLSQAQIAESLGISKATFYAKKAEFMDFMDSLEGGRALGLAQITNALFKSAKDGHFPAIKYYLSTRDPERWSETISVAVAPEHITSITETIVDPKNHES